MRLVPWTIGAATAAAAVLPLISKGRTAYKAYKTLRAIDIRTVNTVAADTRRTGGLDAPVAPPDPAGP